MHFQQQESILLAIGATSTALGTKPFRKAVQFPSGIPGDRQEPGPTRILSNQNLLSESLADGMLTGHLGVQNLMGDQ